ncbi:general negative regulator of transcription subunit 4 [Naviculisporaceae sp. PSN 640]
MAPQDTYIDEDEDYCPLCIEPLDLSDRNFKPCPCGYQICQFCFNNIKTNMNNLCPACRRPYDDKTIQWKVVTPEEIAEFKNRIKQNQKNRAAEQRQKEAQKREAEKENRKNLVGVRVVQKNLVYVTGLTPTIREDELLKTLRKPEFFGQYGTIQKISISNRKSSDGHQQSLGVYVTFEKEEEALRCIGAVNNSNNGDRILRAQLGTTKYCSAWLRHEQCTNRQCMFLHELGDEEDSYSRQDLSSINSINTQRPLASGSGSRSASRQQGHPSPAPAAAQLMVRSNSKDESENGDGPALPATANWARNPPVRSRRGSHATSGAAPSPAISHALPVTAESAEEAVEEAPAEEPVVAGPSGSSTAPAMTKMEKAKRTTDTLASLLKSLHGCTLAWPKLGDGQQSEASYPPLFDVRGWERRRALRDDSESGLAEEQDEPHAAREPSEGEPESSGSLALGGEPEDHGRDSHFDRRPSQPPIQRVANEGLFGPALGASFNHANASLGSIGSRTVTPQQPAFMRPQGAFENAPPGISTPGSLFPGQGHNRQGSRFTFANDNRDGASSTTVKLAANPRIMAQQSSMMPSSFHAQPSNQYYATSMPGPPPGLKSTGTPPSMFGQHGFGAAFRGVSKDSNDILQLINQPRAAGNQGHDAGKRELMFPSFPTQYPPSTSSTPAPATSLLASLYGPPQPNGAFQDFGSKQKKKGKKHRHANTSSSGGSGLVDLADPSILQARMQSQHLQQQSNAGLGQGLFGGQAQDDDLLSLDEVRTSIDALVSDEPINTNIRQPPGSFESFVRSVTPSVPPGLGIPHPHVHASPAISHSSVIGANVGRQTPPVVTPIAPIKSTAPPASPLAGKKAAVASGSEAKKNIKALAAESGLSKEIAKAKTQQHKVLQDEDFPALDTPKSTNVTPVVTHAVPSKASAGKANAAGSKKNAEKAAEKDKDKENLKPAAPSSRTNTPKPEARAANEKRPVPGILNIAAATKAAAQAAKASEQSSTTEKSAHEKDSAFPALPTPSVAPVITASPLTRAAPKTLRVVSTPKAETPQTPAGGIPLSATASVRSSAAFRPETPVSEMISDSVSIISASISASRSNSPPPSKVGSAPVRTTTKSQQRKQRKEALKKDTATIVAQPVKIEPEAEIAPIIGRKKKQKKEKETKEKPSNQKEKEKAAVSVNATPTASRPETPVANPAGTGAGAGAPSKEASINTAAAVKEETSTYRSTANETTTLTEESAQQHKRRIEESRNMAEAGARAGDSGSSSTPKNVPTPASILKELQEAGLVPQDIETLPFFRPVNSHADRTRSDKILKNPATPTTAIVSPEDQAVLLAGQPVRKTVDGVRVLLTPNGDCVKNLTKEEEDRFLELQAEIAKLASDPAAFVYSRHEAPGGFSLIKGRAVPNGPPGYFPQAPGAFPTDPVNKIQREEALTYINQYVLPRLNLNARDMSFPKAMGGEWSGASAHGGDRNTSNNSGASLANAAANLNSLGSWMYGGPSTSVHDSADVAAPELNYPGPVGAFADSQSYLDIGGGRSSVVDDLSDVAHNAFSTVAAAAAAHTAAVNASGRSLSAAAAAAAAANAAHAGGASSIANGAGTAPGSFGNVPLMTLEDAEQALAVARKEADKLEKSFNQFLRKNRRLLTMVSGAAGAVGSGGGH